MHFLHSAHCVKTAEVAVCQHERGSTYRVIESILSTELPNIWSQPWWYVSLEWKSVNLLLYSAMKLLVTACDKFGYFKWLISVMKFYHNNIFSSVELMDWLGELSSIVLLSFNFYTQIVSFIIRSSVILMELGMNDVRTTGYKVTEHILNICINYASLVDGSTKQPSYFSQEVLVFMISNSVIAGARVQFWVCLLVL